MTEPDTLGFYGKIPSNGDFVTRQLPRSFVEPWDQWLQESILSSRQQLGDDWLEKYLVGPIWRFAISAGVCDENPWVGVVMPSVDSVGRYFPLTLAVPVNPNCRLLFIADQEESWFNQLEDIALSALDQNNKLDMFNQDIIGLAVPDHFTDGCHSQADDNSEQLSLNADFWRMGITDAEPLSANLNSLIEPLLLQRFPDLTVWWSHGSEQVEASILICNKLPPAEGFSALLTGDWNKWGWQNKFNSVAVTDRQDTLKLTNTIS